MAERRMIKVVRTDLSVWLGRQSEAVRACGAPLVAGLDAAMLGPSTSIPIKQQLVEDIARLKAAIVQ